MDLVAIDRTLSCVNIYKDIACEYNGCIKNPKFWCEYLSYWEAFIGSRFTSVFIVLWGNNLPSCVPSQPTLIPSISIGVTWHLKSKLGNSLRIYRNSWKLSLKNSEPNLTTADCCKSLLKWVKTWGSGQGSHTWLLIYFKMHLQCTKKFLAYWLVIHTLHYCLDLLS